MLPQLELIERVERACAEDPGLDAALMYGSFAKDEGDEHSDIEFWLFFRDAAYKRLDQAAWCERVAPVSYLLRNEHGACVAVFPQLIRGEFHFASVNHYGAVTQWPERGAPLDRMIIVDRSGRLTALLGALPDRARLPHNPEAAVTQYCDRFINWLLLAYHLLARGELLRAWDALGHVHRHLLWMARLAEDSTRHWPTPSRAAEQELSPRTLAGLTASTAAADAGALHAALTTALGEGRRHWQAIGGPLPDALFDEISAALAAYHR